MRADRRFSRPPLSSVSRVYPDNTHNSFEIGMVQQSAKSRSTFPRAIGISTSVFQSEQSVNGFVSPVPVSIAGQLLSGSCLRGENQCLLPDTPITRHRDLGSCLDVDTRSTDPINIEILASLPQRWPLAIERNVNWKAIETRTNGTANSNVTVQTVWSAAYLNAPVLQDTYSAGVIQPNSRLYFLRDANWNTTAIVGLVSGSWQVTQRFAYSPYGTITVLTSDWTTTGEMPLAGNLYQGMTLDPVTGLYYARNRNYSPSLGRWINQDPAGYINGANTYQFVMSNPVGNVDPFGLAGEDDDVGGNPETPPPSSFMEGIDEFFGIEPYFGPPIVSTPPGYQWWYPPTIGPEGAPPDPNLWQLQPTDLNNPHTPNINPIGPNGETLTPQQQVDQAQQAMRDADNKNEPEPNTKGPARPPACKDAAKSNPQLRNEWERANRKPWPKDPNTGRNQDVSHKVPKADGGPNTPDNIEPEPHDQHMQRHSNNGDFKRWGSRNRGGSQ